MRSALDNLPVIEYDDFIAELAAAHAVRDEDGSFIFDQLIEVFIDFRFRQRIQRRGGFVQNDDRRVFIQCPCNRRLLRFPSA